MGWIVGLKRSTAVVCGAMGAICLIAGITDNHGQMDRMFGLPIFGMGGAFLVYKILCWLIDGFAEKSSP